MDAEIEKIIKDWKYFCSRINFGVSALDADAVTFMDTFSSRIRDFEKRIDDARDEGFNSGIESAKGEGVDD